MWNFKKLNFPFSTSYISYHSNFPNHVPIESVSKMLGDKSLKITRYHTNILDEKVSDEMNILRNRINLKSSKSQNNSKKTPQNRVKKITALP